MTSRNRLAGRSWLDALDYGKRRINGGRCVPWGNVGEFVGFQRSLLQLTGSDVVEFPLQRYVEHHLGRRPELVEAMGAKQREGYALRRLLQDEDLIDGATALAAALVSTFNSSDRLIALSVPSPGEWLRWADRTVAQDSAPVSTGESASVSAGVRIADFLRAFGRAGVDVLLLADAQSPPLASEPVVNVARYYGWAVGVDLGDQLPQRAPDDPVLDFVICEFGTSDVVTGRKFPASFWCDGATVSWPENGFLFGTVPEAAEPEAVLAAVKKLR